MKQPAKAGPAVRQRAKAAGTASKVATLATALSAIDPADPQRRRKALRAFVEATLQDEFGSELIMAPDFQHMVDRTIDALLEDGSMTTLLDDAVRELGISG